jgi:hypothetical protein
MAFFCSVLAASVAGSQTRELANRPLPAAAHGNAKSTRSLKQRGLERA